MRRRGTEGCAIALRSVPTIGQLGQPHGSSSIAKSLGLVLEFWYRQGIGRLTSKHDETYKEHFEESRQDCSCCRCGWWGSCWCCSRRYFWPRGCSGWWRRRWRGRVCYSKGCGSNRRTGYLQEQVACKNGRLNPDRYLKFCWKEINTSCYAKFLYRAQRRCPAVVWLWWMWEIGCSQ